MHAKREQAIHFPGEAGRSARIFPVPRGPVEAAQPELEGPAWTDLPRRIGRSLERRLVGGLSRRVVGDLCLMVEALLIGLSGFVCPVIYYRYYLGLTPNYLAFFYLGLFSASLFFLLSFAVFRLRFKHLASFRKAMAKTLLAFLLTVTCLLLLAFVTKTSATYSRGSFLAWTGSSALLLLGANALFARHVAKAAWLKRCARREAVIVGGTELVGRFLCHLRASGEHDLRMLGIFDEQGDAARWRGLSDSLGVPYRGHLDGLVDYVLEHQITEVLVALPWQDERRITAIVERLDHLPVDVKLCPDRIGYALRPAFVETVGGALVTAVHAPPIRDWSLIFKSVLDIALSMALLAALAPVFALIGLLIRWDSPGPVLFRQKRHGFNHDVFELYKFRTLQHAPGAPFAQTRWGDPRVTRVGRWLRLFSLDELPQLINVLQGEMSLVGPRPHPMALNLEFMDRIKRYATRHRVKPGITGWAQVNGWRGATDTAAKMEGRISHDLFYIENWSLLLDLKILALTVVTGFGLKNAH